MRLNVIKGLEQAGELLTRVDPLDLNALPEAVEAQEEHGIALQCRSVARSRWEGGRG